MGVAYPCPCRGYLVFDKKPGPYDICPICFWEDDLVQLRFVSTGGGANSPSLIQAQKNYRALGASERRCRRFVRAPRPDERREVGWRPVDPTRDNIEEPIPDHDYGTTYPPAVTVLYYWRETYWRRAPSA
jgi:hypothetical protein